MSKSLLIKDSSSNEYPPIQTFNHKIKPFPKTSIHISDLDRDLEDPEQERQQRAKKYQIKKPKWASLHYEITADETFETFKTFKKSLKLTSTTFDGRQYGTTVGHWTGEVKYLEKISRYLRKLHFNAAAIRKKKFIALKRWVLRLKCLQDLSMVPYWFPYETEEDYEGYKLTGVARLIYRLSPQIIKLAFFGFTNEEFIHTLDFKRMNHLQHFTIKAALTLFGCDGHSEEFEDIHIKFIEKALQCRTLNTITLHNEYDTTPRKVMESLINLIFTIKKPFIVHFKMDSAFHSNDNEKWLKEVLEDIPANLKIMYSILEDLYFLSVSEGIEIEIARYYKNEFYEYLEKLMNRSEPKEENSHVIKHSENGRKALEIGKYALSYIIFPILMWRLLAFLSKRHEN